MGGSPSATDVLVVMFHSLSDDEQEEVYEPLAEPRVRWLAGTEDSSAFIRSMQRVAEYVGHIPSSPSWCLMSTSTSSLRSS
jgi:hypothetical protein